MQYRLAAWSIGRGARPSENISNLCARRTPSRENKRANQLQHNSNTAASGSRASLSCRRAHRTVRPSVRPSLRRRPPRLNIHSCESRQRWELARPARALAMANTPRADVVHRLLRGGGTSVRGEHRRRHYTYIQLLVAGDNLSVCQVQVMCVLELCADELVEWWSAAALGGLMNGGGGAPRIFHRRRRRGFMVCGGGVGCVRPDERAMKRRTRRTGVFFWFYRGQPLHL